MKGTNSIEISVVIPVYQCASIIGNTVEAVKKTLDTITPSYEIILVDDRAPDNAWQSISELAAQDSRIKGVKLSRNFGQEGAVLAGVHYAQGEYLIIMDCDLQEDPAYIKTFYQLLKKQEADIVFSIRKNRQQNPVRRFLTNSYNWAFRYIAGVDFQWDFSALTGFNRKVRKHFLQLKERHRNYAGLLIWLGFKQKFVRIEHLPGLRGKTSYSITKFLRTAIDAWVSHSVRLLYWAILSGLFFALLAVLGTIYVIIQYFLTGNIEGWTSLITSLLLSTSIVLFQLGIIGIYLGKLFEQQKERPMFIPEDTLNIQETFQGNSNDLSNGNT